MTQSIKSSFIFSLMALSIWIYSGCSESGDNRTRNTAGSASSEQSPKMNSPAKAFVGCSPQNQLQWCDIDYDDNGTVNDDDSQILGLYILYCALAGHTGLPCTIPVEIPLPSGVLISAGSALPIDSSEVIDLNGNGQVSTLDPVIIGMLTHPPADWQQVDYFWENLPCQCYHGIDYAGLYGSSHPCLAVTGTDDPTASTYNANGNGTLENPYKIYTPFQLEDMSKHKIALAQHYLQCQDISFDGFYSLADHPYFSIGSSVAPFIGSYDGNGFEISHFTLDVNGPFYQAGSTYDSEGNLLRNSTSHTGLFGSSEGATFQNIRLSFETIRSNDTHVGGLVGLSRFSEISNTAVSGTVNGTIGVGGLVGQLEAGSSLTFSSSEATVEGTGKVGGLVGLSEISEVNHSFAIGTVQGGNRSGGLIGENQFTSVSHSYASGNVSGLGQVGGLIGLNTDHSNISHCYALGAVMGGDDHIGGLIGQNSIFSSVSNVYARGSAEGDSAIGGLIGSTSSSMISNVYSTGSVLGNNHVGGLVGLHLTGEISNAFSMPLSISSGANTGYSVGKTLSSSTLSNIHYLSDVTCSPSPCTAANGEIPHSDNDYFFSASSAPMDQWDFANVWLVQPNSMPILQP